MHNVWFNKKYKDKKKCALMCTWLRVNVWRFLFIFLLTLLSFAFDFSSIFLIKVLINYFQGQSFYDISLPYLGSAFLVFKLFAFIIQRQVNMYQVSTY